MENEIPNKYNDIWKDLSEFTDARIALGHVGHAIPLSEVLNFKLAHAHAKDAVFSELDHLQMEEALSKFGLDFLFVKSNATTREEYLQRPDKGRSLDDISIQTIKKLSKHNSYDIAIVIGDGLSATAINENAIQLLSEILEINKLFSFKISPIIIVENARVAIGDQIGALLNASLVLVLIGERPGLKSFNSMGAYITFQPKVGKTDETRNCISNIRKEGLPIQMAAEKIMYLIKEALRLQLTGVQLKDHSDGKLLS